MEQRKEPKNYRLSTEAFPIVKQILFLGFGWLGFQILAVIFRIFIVYVLRGAYADDPNTLYASSYWASMAINSLAYVSLLIILLFVAYADIPKLLKSFKQWQSALAGVICFAAIMAFNIQYSMFLTTLKSLGILKTPVTDNINQQSLVSLESLYPFASLIVFGFIGPICEELTYRVGLFSLCKRKARWLAYLVTIIVFSFIHFNYNSTSLVNEIMNLPYYAFAAAAFSFTYDHFGFAGSLIGHVINNVVSLAFIVTIR